MTAERLAAARLVPVVRAGDPDAALAIVRRLLEAGVRAVELTATIPDWPAVVAEVLAGTDRDQVCVGVGTMLSAGDVERAVGLGADFLVSPVPVPELRGPADDEGVLFVEGAFTPREVFDVAARGVVKLFPAHVGGPAYLRSLLSVFPQARIMPTGGIRVADVGEWLASGALAVGVGRDLYEADDVAAVLAAAVG